jgi:glycosyltransferase involved in cell wall biosynthesis
LKILYFSRDFNVHDERFLKALAKTGHQIFFLRLEKRACIQPQNNGMKDGALPAGVTPVTWAGGQADYSDDLEPHLLTDLKRVIDQVQPDLIQAGPLHLSAYLAARCGFQPLVSMSWGYDLLYDAPRSAKIRQAIRFTLENSATMVGDCNTIRQLAISYGMPDERIVIFPWGIDLEHFSPAPKAVGQTVSSTKEFVILSTRGWEPIYGVEEIARAFVQAAAHRPELRLVMLGSGSQAVLIQKILGDGGVLDKVQFPGQVDQTRLPGYYQSADLYISASHSDGTSISLLEALACGKPVIVSDIPGNREWIEQGNQGWLYPEGDAGALAEAILTALKQREKLFEMGRSARRLAEQRADWTKNFPELFKAYQIALNVPNARTES